LESAKGLVFVKDQGVLQGESASPAIFNLFLEGLTSRFTSQFLPGIKLGKKSVHFLFYADDLIIVAHSKEALQEKIKIASNFFTSVGLKANLKKTQVIVFRRGGRICPSDVFQWRGEKLCVVKEYKYLGVIFSSSGTFNVEANHAVQKGLMASGSVLQSLKRPRNFPLHSTTKLLNSIIHSSSLYGSGIWGINYGDQLERVQQRFLKRFFQLPTAAPGYFVRREAGTPHIRVEVLKQAYNF